MRPTAGSDLTETDPCAVWQLPADRIVCANSHLAAMHLAVRRAYDQAIAAHADTEVTGADETAWLAARDEATDPGRLALLYDRRLRELTAATEAARKREEPIF